ncbi:MAG: aminoacyl--tRNA ligase-related protein [bacterium]|nr:aminoacyl--tRNA ligase-related protein [bacterium]
MKQSHLFTKTQKFAPKDEITKNAQLLSRAGYIHKEMAGVYSYLPLGLRVLKKIEDIVRHEMDNIGGQEIRMATLHPSEPWKKTGAWNNVDVVFKINSRTEKEYTVGQSEEEIVTPIAGEYAKSYKDLPVMIYQIGQKYRDELRAKSGIMRGREFGMKDMYSFHSTQEDFDNFYEVAKDAYLRIYTQCGLEAKATEAAGGSFSEKISYEFMVITDAGEDDIFYCTSCSYCVNVEISKQNEADTCTRCNKGTLKRAKASEVGNIFDLGTKYAKALSFQFKDTEGKNQYPIMGCFGIGTTRLMGVIVEALSDDKGIVWPASVAPFDLHLVAISGKDKEKQALVSAKADELYTALHKAGVEVLYDDRIDLSTGVRLAESDLLGIPYRLVVSEKTLEKGAFELTTRATKDTEYVSTVQLIVGKIFKGSRY